MSQPRTLMFPHRIGQGRRARGGLAPRVMCVFPRSARRPWPFAHGVFPKENEPRPPRARRPCLHARCIFPRRMGRGRARKLVRFPAQNGPGPPRARRPWPFAHGKFPHAECAKAAARATALPSCAAHFPTQNRRMGPGRLARGGPALRAQCGSPTRMGSCSACCPAKNWPGRSARGGRESFIAPDRKHTPEPRLTWKSNRSPVRFHFVSRPTWRLVYCG